MTTTEMISLLRQNEHGGASGRPREVYFDIGDRCINTDGIEVTGSGDGLFAELYLSLPCADLKGKWLHDKDDTLLSGYCSRCGWESIIMETDVADMPYCHNCGADMRGGDDE